MFTDVRTLGKSVVVISTLREQLQLRLLLPPLVHLDSDPLHPQAPLIERFRRSSSIPQRKDEPLSSSTIKQSHSMYPIPLCPYHEHFRLWCAFNVAQIMDPNDHD